eukprot:m.471922 g.471922  ORF g.471922 m.471922 type:complete len:67 (+) comp57107_c1_seq13:3307-3507(+)
MYCKDCHAILTTVVDDLGILEEVPSLSLSPRAVSSEPEYFPGVVVLHDRWPVCPQNCAVSESSYRR